MGFDRLDGKVENFVAGFVLSDKRSLRRTLQRSAILMSNSS